VIQAFRVPVIVGPTGIGKSALAFELAMQLGGEIVVADSRQVYERLDIATNKPNAEQRRRVRYHMIDFVDPAATFNAGEYVEGARAAIEDIAGRRLIPIVEGGTMLYVDALCDGFNLAGVPPDDQLRHELAQLDITGLRERLVALDPDPGVDLQNPVRMVRAIEILEVAGPPLRSVRRRTPPPWEPVRVGLTADLAAIDRRLEERSHAQVETAPVLTGIGYAEALAHIKGELTLEELSLAMARSNRRYARRQLRWWRRDDRVRWFEIEPNPLPAILKYVKEPA
jgi:tRNA dimethylallyltransferase